MKQEFWKTSFEIFDRDWALLTAGEKGGFNSMTVSWGGLGTLWNKPVATVYVKPVRHTHGFMEQSEYFTLGFYEDAHREVLERVYGSLSGRDVDKTALSGFTPVFGEGFVTYRQAWVTLVCKKIYRQDMQADGMPDGRREEYYKDEAPHTVYWGEVVQVLGAE